MEERRSGPLKTVLLTPVTCGWTRCHWFQCYGASQSQSSRLECPVARCARQTGFCSSLGGPAFWSWKTVDPPDEGAEANRDFAKKLALEANLRGHCGIYRTLKAPDAAHVRPFRNIPAQDRQRFREKQWYGQWEVIDKPVHSAERERLRWEAMQQARRWEDLDPHEVMKRLWKFPQKACGPDGISCALLKNLPIEGVAALCNMLRSWDLAGRLPLLLPKNEDIERPISLTSVLYRTWCKLWWNKLHHWQSSVGQRLPWERSLPGDCSSARLAVQWAGMWSAY